VNILCQGQADPAWSPDNVKCPLCKYRTFLGPTSIQGLPLNSAAIKHSSQTSGLRSMLYGRELHDLQPRSAAKGSIFTSCDSTTLLQFLFLVNESYE